MKKVLKMQPILQKRRNQSYQLWQGTYFAQLDDCFLICFFFSLDAISFDFGLYLFCELGDMIAV